MYYDATQCASPSQTWPEHGTSPMEKVLNMSLANGLDSAGYVEVTLTFSPYSRWARTTHGGRNVKGACKADGKARTRARVCVHLPF